MWRTGYIVRNMRGVGGARCASSTTAVADGLYLHFYDATHPGAREFVWERVREGYYRHGIDVFWLDACEPEMLPLAPDNLRFHAGPRARGRPTSTRAITHAGFFDGMRSDRRGRGPLPLSLGLGRQPALRGGRLVRATSTPPSRRSGTRSRAGLNMAISGIPWWTHDIGGFRGGDPANAEFRELLVRWFQFGAFSPIFRMHGHRLPDGRRLQRAARTRCGRSGTRRTRSCARYLGLRERLRPYVMSLDADGARRRASRRCGRSSSSSPMTRPAYEVDDRVPVRARSARGAGPRGRRAEPRGLPAGRGRGGPTHGPARPTTAARPSRWTPRWSGSRCSCATARPPDRRRIGDVASSTSSDPGPRRGRSSRSEDVEREAR